MRVCRGCGREFEPTWHRQFYHDKACAKTHRDLRNRDHMKKRRGSPIGRINIGGLMDLIDKDGPMQVQRGDRTYIFSTISRGGRVEVPA